MRTAPYHELCEDGYFFDNTSYFQDAFSTRLAQVRILGDHASDGDE